MLRICLVCIFLSFATSGVLLADPIGFVDTVGTTHSSRQHSGEVGRIIALDAFGSIHVAWMNAMDDNVPPQQRRIYYNMRTSEGEWMMPGGCLADGSSRGGYPSLAVLQGGNGIISYHGNGGMSAHAQVCVDFMSGVCVFDCFEFPAQPTMMIEPHIARDTNGRIHSIFTSMTMEADSFDIWHSSAMYDTNSGQFEGTNAMRVGAQLVSSHNVACARHSPRVALGWSQLQPDHEGDYHAYNNDIFLKLSEDGGETWGNVMNLTSFLPPDLNELPDTTLANQDTLRAYNDCALFFDEQDYLHVAFTTVGYWAMEGLTTDKASMIWHWSEETGVFSPLAEGWQEIDGTLPGGMDRIVQQPSMGMDTTTDYLYCAYMRTNPEDISPSGFRAADIWATVSTDGGMSWAEGTNLTQTLGSGQVSAHECDASLAEIVDGWLHLFYESDIGLENSTPSLNPMIYQEVSYADIAATPAIPWRPLHVDYSSAPPMNPAPAMTFRLLPAFPNPFNATTVIPFELKTQTKVSLVIYDILGRQVETLIQEKTIPAGSHRISWTAPSQASGVFFAHLKADGRRAVQRLVLVK